jgi:hypothetical protein
LELRSDGPLSYTTFGSLRALHCAIEDNNGTNFPGLLLAFNGVISKSVVNTAQIPVFLQQPQF